MQPRMSFHGPSRRCRRLPRFENYSVCSLPRVVGIHLQNASFLIGKTGLTIQISQDKTRTFTLKDLKYLLESTNNNDIECFSLTDILLCALSR